MTVERIDAKLSQQNGRKALIPYVTCGDINLETTLALMHALAKAGADLIELGVPFSDPMADGPVIQKASERAIANGVGLSEVLETVAKFRETDQDTPLVLMGYANSFEAMGHEQFSDRAGQAGVDGVLVVDYPPEEYGDFETHLKRAKIAPIFLLAPTSTDERIQQIARIASGYVYYVSLKGVTGSAALDVEQVRERVQHIKASCNIPVGVGFGIRDAESARAISQVADAIVIGSKLIQTVNEAVTDSSASGVQEQAVKNAADWLAGIRQAVDAV